MKTRMSAWTASAALLLLMVASLVHGQGITQNPISVPVEVGSTPPSDTTKAWFNTTEGAWWRWMSGITGGGAWADLGEWIYMTNVNTGEVFMRVGQALEGDTLQTAPNGYTTQDSLWVSEWEWSCNTYAPTGVDGGLKLYEANLSTAPVLIKSATWTGTSGADTVRALVGPCKLPVLITVATGSPGEKTVKVRVHRFQRAP